MLQLKLDQEKSEHKKKMKEIRTQVEAVQDDMKRHIVCYPIAICYFFNFLNQALLNFFFLILSF